jgi:hypothetical protein
MFEELENENMNEEEAAAAAAAAANTKTSKSAGGKRESKLIELNLANNQFVKMPECLSCLAPKLVKLNLSSNRIESMGAVCDLPAGLKFLDLSNNLIRRSMHLINDSLLKFILYYYSKYTCAPLSEDFVLDNALISLLLENDFCYANVILKSLNRSSAAAAAAMDNAGLKMSPRGPAALATPMYLMSTEQRASENLRAMSKQRLSSGSQLQVLSSNQAQIQQQVVKRRTRSQSRSARTLLASPPVNTTATSQQAHTQAAVSAAATTQKRLLPFDLFLVNLKYNQAYAATGSTANREPQTVNRQHLVDSIHAALKSDLDLERKEKVLLNAQNLQVFLEQLCPHKRHIKLESLKSINLSQNKIKKFSFMIELASAQCSVEDLERLNQPKKDKHVRFYL